MVANLADSGVELRKGIARGLERESLRITKQGKLSADPHPAELGSALTNQYVTTDYAESLLEFITPVEHDIETSLNQLRDIQKFAQQATPEQFLWPMSMPCFVGEEDDIKIAQYGSSNIGKMKTLYRQGLKHRYGSFMQVISGIHFNISFPEWFWQHWAKQQGVPFNQDAISAGYLALIRNLKRHIWLVSYLFGASPALCSSFLDGKKTDLPFQSIGKGTLYLPYATSLRLSDLGYTNSSQADLKIRYNQLDDYIAGLRNAISIPNEAFAKIGVKVDGEYRQLNSNVLQIENEFYASVRPKRVAASGEKPTDALENRGIQYIELRALDVNPFDDVGLNAEQVRFLDLLITWCALNDSPELHCEHMSESETNLQRVIHEGRKPGLTLQKDEQDIELQQWGLTICEQLSELASLFDGDDQDTYQQAVAAQIEKFKDPSQTPSGKLINRLLSDNLDNSNFGLEMAKSFKSAAAEHQYVVFDDAALAAESVASVQGQADVEAADSLNFDDFLTDYFK